MNGDKAAAVRFLKSLYPAGPWVLTSVQLDRKGIETRTFYPATEGALGAWINKYNGVRNIYFSINPPMREISKKAEREDLKEVAYLHVDVDPRAGEDLSAERERILTLFTERLPAGVPPPTAVIFSGGGYQGLWKLETPIEINGRLELAEDAKRYNQQLELILGGDNCHNVDRILRLPGTVNIPDARKAKKGRVEMLATLEWFDSSRAYPLSLFTAAPAVQIAGEAGFSSGSTVKVSGNVERIASVDELDKWNVPDRVKVIIVQGKHPDEPKAGDNSRSAWVFDVACNLARCEVPDDVIFSILTDPDWGISESVLEMKGNAGKYAIRQIERAKEDAIDPWLRKLNEEHAVIGNIGGKCRVVEESYDHALKRSRLTRQSFEDFRNRYMNKTTTVGNDKNGIPVVMQVGKWWLQHPQRRQYDTIVFVPGVEIKGAYNLWKGFGVVSQPGDCSLYLAHVKNVVCSGDEELYTYLLCWMARAVQQPASPGEVAVVLRGGRGVGKSLFAKEFGRIFGRHFLQISNSAHLVGNFNSHLRDVVLLFADEAFFAGDKKHEGVLKTLITEETITIEAKGIDAEASPNYVHLIMASNDDHVVPAGGDERRFLMLDVSSEHQQEAGYFGALVSQMEQGGREALLHYLLTYDITGFEVRNVPKTAALREQQERTLGQEAEWWYNKLLEGRILPDDDEWRDEVPKEEVLDDYINNARRLNYTRRGNATTLGLFLTRHVPDMQVDQRRAMVERQTSDGYTSKYEKRVYFYKFPTLAEARVRWEELYGSRNWPAVMVQNPLPAESKGTPF